MYFNRSTINWKLLSEAFSANVSFHHGVCRIMFNWLMNAWSHWNDVEFVSSASLSTELEVLNRPVVRQHVRIKVRTSNFKAEQEVDLSRTTTNPRQLSNEVMYHWTADVFWTTDDSRRLRSRPADGKRRSAEVEVWLTLLIEGLLYVTLYVI